MNCSKNQIYDINMKACTPYALNKPKRVGQKCALHCVGLFEHYLERLRELHMRPNLELSASTVRLSKSNTFFDGDKCIKCYHPRYFDYGTMKCKTYLIKNIRHCVEDLRGLP